MDLNLLLVIGAGVVAVVALAAVIVWLTSGGSGPTDQQDPPRRG